MTNNDLFNSENFNFKDYSINFCTRKYNKQFGSLDQIKHKVLCQFWVNSESSIQTYSGQPEQKKFCASKSVKKLELQKLFL